MHPRTVATLGQLENASWFSRVGVKDAATAIVLASWPEAIDHCCTFDWVDLRTDAMNEYRERVAKRSKERWHLWNHIADEVKKITFPLVDRRIEAVVCEHHLPKIFGITVRADITNLCMEAEYADVYPPGFFTSNAYWYVNGHFPCGWRGIFPKGELLIY